MHKLYLVKFKLDNKYWFKIGITSNIDVADRFHNYIKSGIITEFKIYKSSYFDDYNSAYNAEQTLLNGIVDKFGGYDHNGDILFHNLYTSMKIGGITEIRKYNHKEVSFAYEFISKNGRKYYKSN